MKYSFDVIWLIDMDGKIVAREELHDVFGSFAGACVQAMEQCKNKDLVQILNHLELEDAVEVNGSIVTFYKEDDEYMVDIMMMCWDSTKPQLKYFK